jgi:hypothetical protein
VPSFRHVVVGGLVSGGDMVGTVAWSDVSPVSRVATMTPTTTPTTTSMARHPYMTFFSASLLIVIIIVVVLNSYNLCLDGVLENLGPRFLSVDLCFALAHHASSSQDLRSIVLLVSLSGTVHKKCFGDFPVFNTNGIIGSYRGGTGVDSFLRNLSLAA